MSETTNLKLFKHDNPSTNENQFDVTKALNNNWDKIDDFAETTNTKITENQNNIKSLQTDNTTNKKDIATLKSDNTTNKANIKALQDDNKTNKDNIEALQQENEELKAENERLRQDMNAYPSNEAEGEYITLTDSADSRFNKFRVIGKSEQKTRSGKNKIKVVKPTTTVSGVDFTNNEDGSITINGTATANAYFNINNSDENNRNFFTLEKNQNYGLYLGNSAEGLSMICRSSTKNYALLTLPENQNERVQQYTAETDNQCWAYLTVESGVTINNLTVYPMIVKGTEIGEWELYGALPRPNEESPIQNVEGNVNIAITNSNLFGKGFATPKTDTNFWHTVGEGFTPLEDGWGRLELDNTGSSSTGYMNAWSRKSNFLNVIKPSTKYKIIVEWRNLEIGTNISSNYLCICGNNNQEAFQAVVNLYYSTLTTTNKATFTVTTKDNIKPLPFLLRTFISVRAGERLSLEVRISIQSVDTNADYEDGKYQKFVFPLQEGQVLHEEDYLADDGIHNKRITIIFDGTESSWAVNTNATNEGYSHFRYNNYPNLNVESSSTALLCSHFKRNPVSAGNYINDTSGSNILYIGIDNNIIGVTDSDDNSTKLTKWKNWLANQYENGTPVTIETRLKEETITPYADEQKKSHDKIEKEAKSYKTVTNIFSTNEVSPKFEVEYRQDIKSLINNVSQAVLNNA